MELWIRSQNKEKLVKVNDLNLYDSNILKNAFILTKEYEKDYSKFMIIANDNVNLGTYKKERALEVLDEIQRHIAYNEIEILSGNACNISYDEYVYEMPLE